MVHVSDTPRNSYGFLRSIIRKARPDILIHTGDVVDDIKLEREPNLINRYVEGVKELQTVLSGIERVIIVPGNEDDVDVLRRFFGDSVVSPGSLITVEGIRVALGHKASEVIKLDADLKLYGHNFEVIPKGLNGLRRLNLILLPSMRVFRLRYPLGTDEARGYRLLPGM